MSNKLASGLAIILGVLFVLIGGMKLVGAEMLVQQFRNWGYPVWFMYAVGLWELASAALLLVRRTRLYGAIAIMILMVGAIFTHVRAGEVVMAFAPLIVLVLAGMVARGEKRAEEVHHPA